MDRELRLLLVEDSADDATLLARTLGKGGLRCRIRRVETPAELEAGLAEGGLDLVISDLALQGWDGMACLRAVRRAQPDLPFLLVSGQVGEELAVEAMRAGANDFLLKDKLHRLVPAIERELREADQHRAHRRAEAERDLLHVAINDALDWVAITDPAGVIQYANPAVTAISGYSQEELLGQTPRLLRSHKHDPSYYQQLWSTLLGGNSWRGRIINRRKDGSFWESDMVICPVKGPDGATTGYIWTARDVTREVELRNQLEQSQRLEAIGRLASGIAHDFNNALMPILVTAEAALDQGGLTAQVERSFQLVQKAAERARDLVRRILAFSRKTGQELRPMDLAQTLDESLRLVRSVLPSRLALEASIPSGDCWIQADPTQIHQVVLNLLMNAAHAMSEAPGRIQVGLAGLASSEPLACSDGEALPAGDYYCLEVADQGRGMAVETLEKMFLPFFTTKGPNEGTGLGLSIVHGIVRGMGGGVQVASVLGEGSSFRVYLPTSGAPAAARAAAAPGPRRPLRVLLVDDEPVLVENLDAALASRGYQVSAFTSSLAALEAFRADPSVFDVLLTDLTMPGLSGLQVAQTVQSLRPGFPVVLMTGLVGMLDQDVATRLRFREVLEKPKSAAEVAEALERAVAT